MSDTTLAKVSKIIAEQAMVEVAEVKPESTPSELGVDSLGLVEMVFAVEEEFNITVPFNANDPTASDFDISSVQAVADGVEKLVAEQS